VFVSTGAARATQMLEILRHAAGQDDTRSPRRRGCGPRWRIAGATQPRQRARERT
jgi:hypothetical protein